MPKTPKMLRDAEPMVETEHMIPLVVGAHPRAEYTDRPIAYCLRERMSIWLNKRAEEIADTNIDPITPMVVTDVWYLNDASLRERPSISIGGPSVNAFTAYLADKLPSVFAIDGVMMVQMDPQMSDVVATCWGQNAIETQRAIDVFCEKYLDQFMEAAIMEL